MTFKAIITNIDELRIKRMFKFSTSSVKNMEGVYPEIVTIFKVALEDSPIDFGVPKDGGVRSAESQNEMFNDPDVETQCDGYESISNHQEKDDGWGYALDFYAYVDGRASWDKVHLSLVAGTILSTANRLLREGKVSIRLKWGGEFGSNTFHGWDYPHIEGK